MRSDRRGACRAVILDMDGVVTRTATLHARAWKRMLDEFMRQRTTHEGEDLSEFDIERDYRRHIDGKPRYDGVRDFLASRGILLPEGSPDDEPEADTVYGLGKRKNEIFHELLHEAGVETWPDAIEQIRRWRRRGVATALITASRNGRAIVEAADIGDLFDAMVDGIEADRLGLKGKPAPDIFLEAARRLDVEPDAAMVVEDAVAGVEAGRAGGFGRVVGVDRDGGGALGEHGADTVVRDLREVDGASGGTSGSRHATGAAGVADVTAAGGSSADECSAVSRDHAASPPSALERLDRILDRIGRRRPVFFFDYDGTLTPIAMRPEQAVLSDSMRARLRELARTATVAIISGRDLDDVRELVGLDGLYYAGSHGFDIAGPGGMRMQHEEAKAFFPVLERAERRLRDRLRDIEGAWVERKRFALAVHYREADEEAIGGVAAAVDQAASEEPGLRRRGGKKIFDLQPDVPWDKGRAVHWLLDRLGLEGPDALPIYVGDDTTDEDAFGEVAGRGIGIRIGSPDEPTAAEFVLADTEELRVFLDTLLDHLPPPDERDG